MNDNKLKILVLGGGPDLEREVSLASATAVAAALKAAGHDVTLRDPQPHNPSCLQGDFDIIFPVLHGPFGEGGPLQDMLEAQSIPFVGCSAAASRIAIDKVATKKVAIQHGIPTPAYQVISRNDTITLPPPLVLKPISEGSSFGVEICKSAPAVQAGAQRLFEHHDQLLAEQFVAGPELTVGIIDGQALPPIQIVPAVEFYDYDAKYKSNETQYRFDINLPAALLKNITDDAVKLFNAIGCRHVSRVDFLVDDQQRHWLLEINTLPGFTDHSLVPKAAAKLGMDMPALCDRLVRLALAQPAGR